MKALTALAVTTLLAVSAQAQPRTPQDQAAFEIFKELVEMNTVTTTRDTGKAAEAIAARLVAAGLPRADVHVFKPACRRGMRAATASAGSSRTSALIDAGEGFLWFAA